MKNTYHKTPVPGYRSLLERIFGRKTKLKVRTKEIKDEKN